MDIQNTFFTFYQTKSFPSFDASLSSLSQTYPTNILIQLYKETFLSYYSSSLTKFFQTITQSKILYCEHCVTLSLSKPFPCIASHNIQNIPISFDSLFNFFGDVIQTETFLQSKLTPNVHTNLLSCKLANNNITSIATLMKLQMHLLLEKFKSEKNINDPNIIISPNIKTIIKTLLLEQVYDNIISDFIKNEIQINLNYFIPFHNKQILNDLIQMFSDYYLEWAYLNTPLSTTTNITKQEYKASFISILKQQFIKCKLNIFFDIISTYPSSAPTLQDIKLCMDNYDQQHFIETIQTQLKSRLLTPGISTRLIIEIFIRIIKIMKTIEPSSFLLELISSPIKEYLRTRKDTMQWIVTTILSEDDTYFMEDMSKAYVRNIKNQDYDYMSSDDEPEKWSPVNTQGISSDNTSGNDFKNKMTDIISTLVNIFGSPEKFMEQYKRMLSERRINDDNFSLDNEIKNLEMLKLKFGEALLQNCDVIIKDIKDSYKLNTTDIKDELISCLVTNKNYWPFIPGNDFDINNIQGDIDENTNLPKTAYDNFLNNIKQHMDYVKTAFEKKKFSRKLNMYSNIGYAELTLTFPTGQYEFVVSPLSAFVIKVFDKENEQYFNTYNAEYISKKLKAEVDDVKKKLAFWVTKGVLNEIVDGEGDVVGYKPNDKFRNLEGGEVIVEEEIYNFQYPAESTNSKLIENSIVSIIKNSGPKNFEQLYKNLFVSYQLDISEIKLKDLLGKMTLEQKLFKEGENFNLIVTNYN